MMLITNANWRSCSTRSQWQILASIILATAVVSIAYATARPGENGSSGFSEQVADEELQVLGTHISPMIEAHFTADGKWIVVAGTDGVTLHDAATSRCVHWFNGLLAEVSPDGKSILLEHSSGPAELWSIPDAKLIWRLPHDVQSRDMHFSDDAQYIVCGYRDLLRIETREVVYRAPKGYFFDTFAGGDVIRNLADASQPNEALKSEAKPSVLPYIYRTRLRHDARRLITPGSDLCSPAGRFMIIQTGEKDTSLEPTYSLINRETEGRLLEDVASAKSLFFREDQYVVSAESVVRTSDGRRLYSLPQGVTALEINADQSMLAVGLQSGSVDVVEPLSGKLLFRLAVKEPIDSQKRKPSPITALAFSNDSKRLAVVGSKLTLMDIPSHTIISKLDIATQIYREGNVAFNADGSRLLVTMRGSFEWGPTSVCVHQASDLKQLGQFCSSDHHDHAPSGLQPVCFSPDGKYAMVSKLESGSQSDHLRLWDTETGELLANIWPRELHRTYRDTSDFPDTPKRHLGLGRFRNWSDHDFVLDPGMVETIASRSPSQITESGKRWLETFVRVSPLYASWHINGSMLHHPEKQWVLRFKNYVIDQLVDLSTGKIYPQSGRSNHQATQQLEAEAVPEECWGCEPAAITFSPNGSRLLMSINNRQLGSKNLALFEMPSGKRLRSYGLLAESIEEIVIAPNNRIAAISTSNFHKTWIIDLETSAALMELPKGGKCTFSPDSRWAQVGDRNGNSYHLMLIEKSELVGFEWAKHWSFSPNSRFAVGGSDYGWFFLDLATGEKTQIAGRILTAGSKRLLSTRLKLPYEGRRFLCVDGTDVSLFDMNTAKALATFNPVQVASEHIQSAAKPAAKHETVFTSDCMVTPDDQLFAWVLEGGTRDQFISDSNRRAPGTDPAMFSTQVLIGDWETGRQIRCSEPIWSRSRLQHKFVTPDGAHLITISSDKMACWQLQPLKIAWETELSGRWTDWLTGGSIDREMSLDWNYEYAIAPGDQSILIAVDGREAIQFNLATGQEERRLGPLPMNSVIRFGMDGAHLQVGFRSNQSMRQYDMATGKCIKTIHFTDGLLRR